MRTLFEPYGELESVKLVTDRSTGASLGYGFAKFVQPGPAKAAQQELNGYKAQNKVRPGAAAGAAQQRSAPPPRCRP